MTEKTNKRPPGRPRKDTYVVGEAELRKIIRDLKGLYPDAFSVVKGVLKGEINDNSKYKAAIWVIQEWRACQKELEHKLSNDKIPAADPELDELPDEEDENQPTATFSLTMN